MGKVIGIDLGTTNSVVGIADGVQPRVLENREGKSQTKSVVGLKKRRKKAAEAEEPEIIYGDVALDNWPMAPKDTIISIKRLMGRAVADPEVQRVRESSLYDIVEPSDGTQDSVRVVMGDKEFSPVQISTMILQKLKADAEYKLGEEVTHAVITVPAYFSQRQKGDTRTAGLAAGLCGSSKCWMSPLRRLWLSALTVRETRRRSAFSSMIWVAAHSTYRSSCGPAMCSRP